MFTSPQTDQLLPLDEAARLGITANAHDQYDLMRAIARCDELASQIRATQMIHSQNLCRLANRLDSALRVQAEDAHPGMSPADWCSTEDPCPVRAAQGGVFCGH